MAQQMNAALGELAAVIADQDKRIERMSAEHDKLLKAISAIKPTVNMPARPRGFSVEITDDEPGRKKMRVIADSTH